MSKADDIIRDVPPALAPRWKRCQSIVLVHQLNEHCLELLTELAAAEIAEHVPALSANRDLWIRLQPEARRRAARMPFVTLDLHFTNERWWRRVIEAPSTAVCEADSFDGLPHEQSGRLMQETLMFAWQMARSDRTAAQVSFGMRPEVAVMIGELMPGQVRDIASWKSGSLRMRWQNDSHFWRELLLAVGAQDNEAIAGLHLHAKLQLLGPLVYPHP